ncbi:MAG: SoxR reducing system RseC family protein [Nitrospirota bacterium]|nr:SoxR reducing system RseC family protein [Nitrospirota bacterium]
MEEEAVVISVQGENATVRIMRSGSCDGCSAKSTCGTGSSGEEKVTEALNPVGAAPGQRVIISIKPGVVLKASLIVYLLPILVLIGGAILGKEMATSMGNEAQSDFWAAVVGFSLMAIVFAVQWLWNKRASTAREYMPTIIKVA